MSRIFAALGFLCLAFCSTDAMAYLHPGFPGLTFGDNQFYTKGNYGAYMAPFNGSGITHTDILTVFPASFPSGTNFSWSWPVTPACPTSIPGGICGYLALDFGDYDGTVVQTPITPEQVKNITTLNCLANLTLGGLSSGYDVIYDQFLTASPGSGTTFLAEVSVFLHTPSYSQSLINGATQIGTTTISGITWQVAYTPGTVPDYYFTPTSYVDVPNVTLDEKAMFAYLVSQGFLTGNEYFNGLACGVEPRNGAGSALFNSFSVVLT